MACTITIDSITGVAGPGNTASQITVSGTVTGCGSVTVLIFGCSQAAPVPLSKQATIGPSTSPALPAPWKAVFEGTPCQCGQQVSVEAVCDTDPKCRAQRTLTLTCGPCPAISIATPVIGPCSAGTAPVTLSATITPGTGAVTQWEFGDGSFATAQSGASNVRTHKYSGGTFTAKLLTIYPENCPPHSVTFTVPPCECPELEGVTVDSIAGCAGAGNKAKVTLTASPFPPGCTLTWNFGDKTVQETTFTATVTHDYANPGTAKGSVVLKCGECIRSIAFDVIVPPCCPELKAISVTGCVGGGNSATIVVTTDPSGAPGSYTWTFDDGTPAATTTVPSVNHTTAGSKKVSVKYTPADPSCPPRELTATVTVPACPDGPPPPPPSNGDDGDDGDGSGCLLLRIAMLILAILAFFALFIAICVPGAEKVAGAIAASTGAAAAVLAIIWAIFCPNKPCRWPLLLLWQALLGAGVAALYVSTCCPALLVVGIGLIVAGLALMGVWAQLCRASLCRISRELLMVFGSALVPIFSYIGVVPILKPCVAEWVAVAVGTIAGVLTVAVLACKDSK